MTNWVIRTRRRLQGRAARSLRSSLRPAAVLLPILVGDVPEKLLLTRRSDKLRRQPGDIAFPGGAVDPGDPTALHAALRESCVPRSRVSVSRPLWERSTALIHFARITKWTFSSKCRSRPYGIRTFSRSRIGACPTARCAMSTTTTSKVTTSGGSRGSSSRISWISSGWSTSRRKQKKTTIKKA